MKKRILLMLFLGFVFQIFNGQEVKGLLVEHNNSKPGIRTVSLRDVHLTNGFWAERQKVNNEVSLKYLWNRANDFDTGHVIQNFEIAAGNRQGNFAGTNWQDAWLFKWIEASSYILEGDPNRIFEGKRLIDLVDEMIDLIAMAQQNDGYIATQVTTREGDLRFDDFKKHELYTMGHMYTAAVAHYRATGKTNFLDLAEKSAIYIYDFFTKNQEQYPEFPNNPSIIMGSVDLYRATKKPVYLELAKHFVDARGKYQTPRLTKDQIELLPVSLQSFATLNTERINNQNSVPLRKSKEVLGHAVFFTYLYAGATDVYLETGDKTLWTALDRLWNDLVKKKMYVTGAVSPEHATIASYSPKDGVRKNIKSETVHEGISRPYSQPQAHGYNETCGMLGNMMWNWRMLQASGEARFADIMELNWFNSIMSGVEIDGVGWSYANPLRWHAHEHEVLNEKKYSHKRSFPGPRLICCPTNILRNLSAYAGYLYTVGSNELVAHNYAGSELETVLEDGTQIKMTQSTNYPWDGQVTFTIKNNANFTFKTRIPYWAEDATLNVNGNAVPCAKAGNYAEVTHKWKKGDRIDLVLPMEVKLLTSDYLREQTRGQVAVKRGPIVYCLESNDIPSGVNIADVQIPSDVKWRSEYRENLLGGVTVLKTQVEVLKNTGNTFFGFQELGKPKVEKIDIQMIPYFSWNNRDEPKMSVWLPLNVR